FRSKYHLPLEYTVLPRDVSSDGKLPYLVRMASAVRFETGSKLVESTVPALMLSGQIWCDKAHHFYALLAERTRRLEGRRHHLFRPAPEPCCERPYKPVPVGSFSYSNWQPSENPYEPCFCSAPYVGRVVQRLLPFQYEVNRCQFGLHNEQVDYENW